MAAMDNENNIQSAPADSFNLVDAAEASNQQTGQILLVGPDGLVSPATIDEGGVVRELQTTNTTPNSSDMAGSDDILQQAFQEAGNDFPEEAVTVQNAMETEEEITANEGGEEGSISYLTTEDGQIVNSIIESTFTGEDGNQYAVIKSTEDGSQQIIMTGQVNEEGIAMPDEMHLQGGEQLQQSEYFDVEQPLQVQEMVNGDPNPAVVYTDGQEPQPQDIVDEITKPLGSSDNPIRIIQQGNQYTSLQQLTPEQLQHIMQVLQQQQLVKPYQKQGTTTLYSPGSNTKIVYRVVYPGEKRGVLVRAGVGRGRGRGRGKVIPGQRGRGRPRKFPLNDEEIDPTQFPELSKEEKEKKKKMRPRTRSGRVSKPPKHMIKDYKQIHLVDWAEDYDDSDGGYSDFHPTDDEREGDEEDNISFTGMEEDVDSGYGTVAKARNHKCPACGKCYIGQRSLNRHYRLHPDHGTPTADGRDAVRAMNEDSNSSGASAVKPSKAMCTFRRGKLPQRLRSLREVVTHFSNEELMEIVLPRLTQCVSTWEFLLMKSERPEPGGSAMRPSIPEMLREYESLLKDVRQYGSQRVREAESEPQDKDNAVRITDPLAAASLGLRPSVWYEAQPESQPYIPMKFKYSKAASDFKDRMDDFGIGVAEGSAEPPKKRVRIVEGAVNGRTPAVDRTPHVRSLLTEKTYTPEQTITFSPSDTVKGQGHGRIFLDRASGNSKSEPASVQSVSENITLKISDLISVRARDENELVMDTGGEVGDVTHSPEAMLQTTERMEESNTAESSKRSAQISEQSADAENNAQESHHQIDTNVGTSNNIPIPPPVTTTADNSVTTNTPESSMTPSQNTPLPEVTSIPEVDQQAGGDAANSTEDPDSGGNIVIMQTEDGMLLIQKPDGSTIQVQHGGGELSMETVQYLLSMDASQLPEQNQGLAASIEEPIPITEATSQ